MRSFDLSPLFRSTVGFDRFASLFDAATRLDEQTTTYPPYNIEKTGDSTYRITMAVAGFGSDELTLTAQANSLVVTGKANRDEKSGGQFLHRGIAGRAFERRFVLADHIVVEGASLENGLLQLGLKRVVPEALKPRQIPVQAGRPQPQITVSEQADQAQAA